MDPAQPGWLPAFYDRLAEHYEERLATAAGYLGDVFAFLRANVRPGHRVLDLACGPGNLTKALPPEVEVVGIDLSPEMIALAREARPGGTWRVGDFHEPVPAELGRFDVVLLVGAFEFCVDLAGVFAHLGAATRPGGVVLTAVTERRPDLDAPTHRAPAPVVDGFIELRLFGREETEAAARAAGLVPEGPPRAVPGWTDKNGVAISYALWTFRRA